MLFPTFCFTLLLLLCVFATSRETLLKIIHYSLYPILDQIYIEINQQTQSKVHEPQIGPKLLGMNRCNCLNRLDLDDDLTVYD